MKKLLLLTAFVLISAAAFSQINFDLGLKAGVHTSKLDFDVVEDLAQGNLDSEAITKLHWGAFARVGYNRLYVQPEVYFGKKGANNIEGIDDFGDFDYSTVDVPLLLGYQILKGKALDLRLLAGPVFSFVTDDSFEDQTQKEYLEENVIAFQYGLGVDILFLTIDARMENGGNVYKNPELISAKSNTFMITVGFKIF